jgi:hypothetical protein
VNDFFLASAEELAALDTRYGPWPLREAADGPGGESLLPVVEAKGAMDVELATLERILHGESVDDVEAVVDLIQDPVSQEPEADPEAWISPVSDRLVAALRSSDEAQLTDAAEQWVATEEMSGWSRDDAAQLLLALSALCRRGQTEQRGVYRWFTL